MHVKIQYTCEGLIGSPEPCDVAATWADDTRHCDLTQILDAAYSALTHLGWAPWSVGHGASAYQRALASIGSGTSQPSCPKLLCPRCAQEAREVEARRKAGKL